MSLSNSDVVEARDGFGRGLNRLRGKTFGSADNQVITCRSWSASIDLPRISQELTFVDGIL